MEAIHVFSSTSPCKYSLATVCTLTAIRFARFEEVAVATSDGIPASDETLVREDADDQYAFTGSKAGINSGHQQAFLPARRSLFWSLAYFVSMG